MRGESEVPEVKCLLLCSIKYY